MNTTLKGMWETNAKAWAARCVEHGTEIDRLNGKIEKMRSALKIAREYVARVDGTMAFTAPENRLTKPDLDLIDAALKD